MNNSQSSSIIDQICSDVEKIRVRRPLVHNITNYVVMSFTANALLALGASPVMAHAPEEMDEMVGLAGALVVNIGTLSAPWVVSMLRAVEAARKLSIPVVIDPVGAGATRFRTDTAVDLVKKGSPSIIRGNASEILALSGHAAQTKGVDSANTTSEAARAALLLAGSSGAVAAVTGPEDFVTDGKKSVIIMNGHPLMSRVTGTGCAASALMGAFCAVQSDALVAAVGALVTFGIAGEIAARSTTRPGTYQMALLDEIDAITPDSLKKMARLEWGNGV